MPTISDILKKSTDTPLSFTDVMGRALTGKTTFGKALNQVRSEELKARVAEKSMDLAERGQVLAEKKFDYDVLSGLSSQGNEHAKAIKEAIESQVPQDYRSLVAQALYDEPDDVNRTNAYPRVGATVSRLKSEGRIDLTKKQKESMTPIKVYDPKSQTKYSWKVPATGEIVGEAPPTGGLKAKFNAKTGTFEVSTGGPEMTTATKSAIEEEIKTGSDALNRVRNVRAAFKPEYQELMTRWDTMFTSLAEKFKGVPVAEWTFEQLGSGDKQQLRDYAVYRRRAFESMNEEINRLSGAAVSPQEADRLIKQLPNPGKGLFDGDGPTEFLGKLEDTERELQKVIARYNYAKQHGIDAMSIDLIDFGEIMAKRWDEIHKSLPADQNEMQRKINADLLFMEEFGL